MASHLNRLRKIVAARDATIKAQAQSLGELDDMIARLGASPARLSAASQHPTPSAETDREARAQLAALQRQLRTTEEDVSLHRSLAKLLQGMLQVLAAPERWWLLLLPGFLVRRIKYDRLRNKGLFDARLYAQRYPDVARAKADPLQHYVSHGLEEGRLRT
ncbi:hypothetical protein [Novosphingobium sp. CF614]|uniref:hypothetical protein n=1 Tax=Novosphingobium sp. CF614 TaxID=1884364 RepID=UPI0015A5C757|nr:hypothetical protein [Novosphingobium sp. CF614]